MTAAPLPSSQSFRLVRAADRFVTRSALVESRHSFSFGRHYDPDNTGFGLLLANNEEVLAPGGRFEMHPHRDLEVVTWVLSGVLVHQDSAGHSGLIHPGLAQRMSAGKGITHSERNDGPDPVHLVQMWILPDSPGGEPGHEQQRISDASLRSGLMAVASGRPGDDAAIRLGQRAAALYIARLDAGASVALPDAAHVHLFVPVGDVDLEGAGALATGDAARLTASGGGRVTAGAGGAEILVWAMHST